MEKMGKQFSFYDFGVFTEKSQNLIMTFEIVNSQKIVRNRFIYNYNQIYLLVFYQKKLSGRIYTDVKEKTILNKYPHSLY